MAENTKLKAPLTKGVAKVPMVMQMEALECGAACLTMILAYYDKWIPLEQVRTDCGVSRDGSNAQNILTAARHYGLEAHGYRYETENFREEGQFPCIIHWNFNHFVVLDGFKGNRAYLNDPAKGAYSVSMEEFDESFTGICLKFEPSETFAPSGKRKSVLSFAAKQLRGKRNALILLMALSIMTALIAAINPAFSRIFVDYLLSGKNTEWLTIFIVVLGIFNVIQILASAITEVYSLRIRGQISASGNSSFLWKVLNMPMAFFAQRSAGDIQLRQTSNSLIANTLIETVAPLLMNAFMLIVYFLIMIRYSLVLTAVGLVSLLINALVSKVVAEKRMNITRVAMRDSAILSAATVSGIEMVETIKASGAENGFFARWSGYQASINTQKIKVQKVDLYLGIIPGFVANLANMAVLVLGVWLTMQGQFTVGKVLAFQGFMTLFMAPAEQFILAGQTIQEMRTQMERIDDVMEYPDDRPFSEDYSDELKGKLSGKIEVKNIEFGYAPLDEPLIRDFNLTVMPGKSVAIVGASGCGKSTIAKLISGLYQPWKGEILFDGLPMKEISPGRFHGSLAVVDQEVILFEDTIANNIKMWDTSIEDFEMILAARDAQVHEAIMKRPEGYNHRLIEGGKDFSGGQRQRLEIARVLAQDPTMVIMDEATSALDAKTEYDVVKAIRDRGITCVVIAHRLSTIRSCDEIILMEKGRIIDRGTHSELMKSSTLYQELIASE